MGFGWSILKFRSRIGSNMNWTPRNSTFNYSYLDVANAVLEAVLPHQPLLVPDEVLHLLNLHPELLCRRTVNKLPCKAFHGH